MIPELNVALVQTASGLDPAENRDRLAALVPDDTDLVVLPEAYARDFGPTGSDVSAFAEPVDGPFVHAVDEVARTRGTTVVAGMFETAPDPARPYNTLVVRGASEATYRKIHLYDSFGYRESDRLTGGDPTPVVVDVNGFSVGLMTCYDLRFPELARLLVEAGAEVLVVPAAWLAGPHKVDHWQTLARARAIENTAYVLAVGQPAPRYSGHSLVVGPMGEVLAEAGAGEEVLRASLRRADLEEARRTNPSLENRRLTTGADGGARPAAN
ncbi:carbon-nitrogen hydrolase family protein [Nocardioides sp.]|uniref:carbon-nitrogen hydrolase family protein n=1 Tax=Nocardioides sp. TaxID=35761 RepID=UPI0027326725|nr:carbon-nitrogen hydrolase family protein [Nocardioides sp.]MDP3890951.1 carbon-nitrogen hydrolase family protein [Nocardioides sp.]